MPPQLNPHHVVPPTCDTPDFLPSSSDRVIRDLYGDHVHWNPGTHLDGGIGQAKDQLWQSHYNRLTAYLPRHYHLPSKHFAKRFIETYATLVSQVVTRQHNFETPLVFVMVMLQRDPNIKRNRDIRALLNQRLDEWQTGEFALLVDQCELAMKSHLAQRQGNTTPQQRAKRFNHLMLQGEIRQAVRYITEREQLAVFSPDDITATSSGEPIPVMDVLREKHPLPTSLRAADLPAFPGPPPAFPRLHITDDVLARAATRLSGACGPSGVDGPTFKTLALYHREASTCLRAAYGKLTAWIANSNVPWAAIRALKLKRGLAFNKFPGIRPISAGNIDDRYIAKVVMAVAGPSATEAAGAANLAAGLPAGIEGAIHAAHQAWDAHSDDDNFGFLLIDARNAFNELDRNMMLYVVRHLWPQGARFLHNSYKHWALIRYHDCTAGTATTLFSATGVTQGDPMATTAYCLTLVPLSRQLQQEFPHLLQLWVADDNSSAGPFGQLKMYFNRLVQLGRPYGFHVQPTKCKLVTAVHNFPRASAFFRARTSSVAIVAGARLLGSYLGPPPQTHAWITAKVTSWAHRIQLLAAAADCYPQSAYVGMQRSLQHEWQHLQRTTPCDPKVFQPLEQVMAEQFIPALFQLAHEHPHFPARALTQLPLKQAGLALPNPVTTCTPSLDASQAITSELVRALTVSTDQPTTDNSPAPEPFSLAAHRKALAKGRAAAQAAAICAAAMALEVHKLPLSTTQQRRLDRCTATGTWLTVFPNPLTRTVLSPQEWRDNLFLRFGLTPSCIPATCDGCGQTTNVNHALNCGCGGLIHLRHNEIREEILSIAVECFPRAALTREPPLSNTTQNTLPTGQPIHDPAVAPAAQAAGPPDPPTNNNNQSAVVRVPKQPRGDVGIRGFYENGTTAIIDVRVVNLDSASIVSREAKKVIHSTENDKTKKYQAICESRRESFHPFVVSADGMIGPQANKVLQRLAEMQADNIQRPYSVVMCSLRQRIALAIAKGVHLCFRHSRSKADFHTRSLPPVPPSSEPTPEFRLTHG